jgi:hypothetical protein
MLPYEFVPINPNLYLIRWLRFPNIVESGQFVRALEMLLNRADHKLSFLSDLRKGYLKDVAHIKKLSRLTAHRNCGHTTAFGSVGSQVYAGLYQKLISNPVKRNEGDTFFTLEQAISHLEALQTGITQGINLEEVAHPAHS